MLKVLKSLTAIGLEHASYEIKGAEVFMQKGHPSIQRLFRLPLPIEDSHVKQLYMEPSPITTGVEGYDVLVRYLNLPLTKEKDIDAALVFQAEPLLPYPVEQAFLTRQILNRDSEGSSLTVLALRKDLLEKHLDQWHQIKIEPEVVSCAQVALCCFGKAYIQKEKSFLILHINEKFMTCLLTKKGKLLASYTHQEGLDLLSQAYKKTQLPHPLSLDQIDFQQLSSNEHPALTDAFKRLQQALMKMHYALAKETQGEELEGILITGEGVFLSNFEQTLTQKLNLPVLSCPQTKDGVSVSEKQGFAIPIGLALAYFDSLKEKIDFRQQELSYPYPWKRIKLPLVAYFGLMLALSVTFYFFSQYYLIYQEDKLKQDYVDLLANMNKSYEHFETAFLAKNPLAREKANGEIVSVTQLNQEDLLERLQFLQKDLQATPDSFPLFANIPKVSDVLAWLSQHPQVIYRNEKGNLESRLQIENFSYTMLKRPVQGKKQEKYQVKVEMEFSSPTPKWAREFHDALIAPNDLVDPKGEVKWSSNRGKYRTSFFLKDKTSYPNQ